MAQRMPNPSAVPIVDRSGHLTSEWVRWLQGITGEVDAIPAPTTPAPAPVPAPPPDPGPVTADLISQLSQDIEGLQLAPGPMPDPGVAAALQALQLDESPQLAARIAALERAVNDILQGPI